MLAIIWREIRLHYTKTYWLISNFITPLFYLFFFGLLFSSTIQNVQINNTSINYMHFFIPGLIVMQSFFVWSYTLALVNLDRRTRVIEMINMTSTYIYEYFMGRIVSAQILVFLKAALLWIIAVLFFRLSVGYVALIFIAVVALLISNYIWFCIGFVLGLLIKTEDIRDVVMQLVTLPLTFLSNIYYPVSRVPGILKIIININPLTHATNIIRPALLSLENINTYSWILLCIYSIISTVLILICVHSGSFYQD